MAIAVRIALDIIFPSAAYTEENGLFVNTEGRPQLAVRAGFAPGEAKEKLGDFAGVISRVSGNLALPFAG